MVIVRFIYLSLDPSLMAITNLQLVTLGFITNPVSFVELPLIFYKTSFMLNFTIYNWYTPRGFSHPIHIHVSLGEHRNLCI